MNNRGTDQTAQMPRLVCAFVVLKHQRQVFSHQGQIKVHCKMTFNRCPAELISMLHFHLFSSQFSCTIPSGVVEYIEDPNHMDSPEASWSGSTVFFKLEGVFRRNNRLPPLHSYMILVTLKNSSRSQKSNNLLRSSQWCIYASLDKIWPFVQKIECCQGFSELYDTVTLEN